MEAHFALLRADRREPVRDRNHLRRLEDQTFHGLDVDPTTGFEAASIEASWSRFSGISPERLLPILNDR